MFNTNNNNAQGALEDVVIVNALAAASRARGEAADARAEADVMRMASAKIDELRAIVAALKAELQKEKAATARLAGELAALRERSNEAVAVANGTALTLEDAVGVLKQLVPQDAEKLEDKYLRRVRTRRYDEQVDQMMKQGNFASDPRNTDRVKKRPWYVADLSGTVPDQR